MPKKSRIFFSQPDQQLLDGKSLEIGAKTNEMGGFSSTEVPEKGRIFFRGQISNFPTQLPRSQKGQNFFFLAGLAIF